jgi:hypothetical protein
VIRQGELILVEDKRTLMKKLGRKQLTLQLQEPLRAIPAALQDWPLKLNGDGYELLSAPFSPFEIVTAYVGAAATKSVILGLVILATATFFFGVGVSVAMMLGMLVICLALVCWTFATGYRLKN